MFISHSILKKLMKQAFKTGLTLAQTEDRVYIAGMYWEMDVKREFLPKTILAQIIELAGELPEVGERFLASKEGNQIEIGNTMQVYTGAFEQTIEVTKLMLIGERGTTQRILQDMKTGNVYVVNNVFADIVDNDSIDAENGECIVDKLLFHPEQGILWKNNVAAFRAHFRIDDLHERLLSEIQQIDLTEDPVQ